MAKIKLAADKPIDAFNIINKISKTGNERFDQKVLIEKGRIEAAFGNYELAETYLAQVLKNSKPPIYWTAMIEYARVASESGKYDLAKKYCENLLNNTTYSKNEMYLILGKTAENENNIKLAREYYLKSADSKLKPIKDRAIYFLARLEKKIGATHQAEEYYSEIVNNKKYQKEAVLSIVTMAINDEQFEKANKYLDKLLAEGIVQKDDNFYNKIKLILASKSKDDAINFQHNTYTERQIVNYSEQEAIAHIKREHQQESKIPKSKFKEDLDISTLIKEVKAKLNPDFLQQDGICDAYMVEDYPNIGYTQDKETLNSIRVITVAGTKNILTMYPVNITKSNESTNKVRRLSQIEKFNARYNKK